MLHVLFSALYPVNCLSCDIPLVRGEKEFCLVCLSGFKPLCFLAQNYNPIAQLFWGKSSIHFATAVYDYIKSEKLSQLIHIFKYSGNKEIGFLFGEIMAEYFPQINALKDVDLVTFVPMHSKKKKKRGYNQAEELANSFAKKTNIPVRKLIFRTENTLTQTEKDVYGRFENMLGKFNVLAFHKKLNHILIIDDVITTGATLISCAELLKGKYNCKVSVFTLAYRNL
jgi:ComF family protein|tara:strand:+ start:934 stop:1611 length:678 start_codon:yes stop_codon:yes gene_type:complete